MSSFFGQGSTESTQSPQFGGTSTVEQNTPQTGASTVPAGTGGPSGGVQAQAAAPKPASAPGSAAPTSTPNGGQAAQAPQFTNLATFLGAQAPNAAQNEANAVTQSANTNATQMNAAGQAAQSANSAATAAGTNTGSVGGVFNTPTPSTPAAPTPTPSTPTSSTPAPTSSTPTAPSTPPPSNLSSAAFKPYKVAPPTTLSTTPAPSYDLSNVHLAGYTGPSATAAQNSFNGAASDATQAAQNAAALKSGAPTGNAFDNAALTQTPAFATIQKAITGENQAAQNVGAEQQGAAQAVQNAQNASNVSGAVQRTQLGQAGATEAATASTNAAAITAVGAALANPTVASLSTALNDPGGLQALGLPPALVKQIQGELQSGAISPQDAQGIFSSYAKAANGNSGYSAGAAATTNSINSLLGNGAPTATAGATGSGASAANTTQVGQTQAEVNALKSIQNPYTATSPSQAAQDRNEITTQVALLAQQGFNLQQIEQMSGLNTATIANATGQPVGDADPAVAAGAWQSITAGKQNTRQGGS